MGIEKVASRLRNTLRNRIRAPSRHHRLDKYPLPVLRRLKELHLGINLYQPTASHRWRCGGPSTASVLSQIPNISVEKAKNLIQEYAGSTVTIRKKAEEPRVSIFPIKFPQPYFKHSE